MAIYNTPSDAANNIMKVNSTLEVAPEKKLGGKFEKKSSRVSVPTAMRSLLNLQLSIW